MSNRLQKLGQSAGGLCTGLALVSVALATACAPTADSLGKSLAFASYEFNSGVRWRKYQQAAKRLTPTIRDAYLDHAERTDERINVSEYNLLRTRIDVKRKTAVLRFRYIWHRANAGIVRKSVVVEHWKMIKDEWFVAKILHASGKQEFPLFVGLTPEAVKEKEKQKKKKKKARAQPPKKARRSASKARPQPAEPPRR